MNITEIREKLEKAINNGISAEGKDIVIWGAGNTSMLYENCFAVEGIKPVCFIDSSKEKQGKQLFGIDIVSVDDVRKYLTREPIVFICSTQASVCREIKKLYSDRFEMHIIDEYVYCRNADKVMKVFDILEDDISKATYANMILTRMGVEEQDQSLVVPDQYFALPAFKKFSPNECFVDCGAYVGDTIEQYIGAKYGTFGRIYAFEPCARNYRAMCARIKRLNEEWALEEGVITAIEAGVGEVDSRMSMRSENSGSASLGAAVSRSGSGDGSGVEIRTLDSCFRDIPVSFIKADIESFEESMLKGAVNVIKRDRPRLAVCIYHNASDMYRVPLYVNELGMDYRICIRQHYCEVSETVLYAY